MHTNSQYHLRNVCMTVCARVCISVCVCMQARTCECVIVSVRLWVCMCMNVCECVSVRFWVCGCERVCVKLWVRVCECVSVWLCKCVSVWLCRCVGVSVHECVFLLFRWILKLYACLLSFGRAKAMVKVTWRVQICQVSGQRSGKWNIKWENVNSAEQKFKKPRYLSSERFQTSEAQNDLPLHYSQKVSAQEHQVFWKSNCILFSCRPTADYLPHVHHPLHPPHYLPSPPASLWLFCRLLTLRNSFQ